MTDDIERRSFLASVLAYVPVAALGQAGVNPGAKAIHVPAGEDRFGEHHGLGISTMDFKIATADTGGRLFVLEQANREKGGPARHLHNEQYEWFYVIAGDYIIEVGSERFVLKGGESVLAPRKVPHVWAFAGGEPGRMLVAFTPAGQMEAFFREITKANAMPPQDPALWRRYGMELVGPPLIV